MAHALFHVGRIWIYS